MSTAEKFGLWVIRTLVICTATAINAFIAQWAGHAFHHNFTYVQALILAYIYVTLLMAPGLALLEEKQ